LKKECQSALTMLKADDSQIPEKEMSKSQKKKLLKLKQFEERKMAMRKNEKEKRKLKIKLAKEQGLEIPRSNFSRKALKANKIEKNPAEINVAIDLSFDDLMMDKDLASCAAQLMRAYTYNRRAKQPIPLYFTGLKENGKMYEKLERNEGWRNWDIIREERSFMDVFEKEKIIYLTSESDNVLDTLEKGATYVIGGLVDHNHHKSLCFDNAQKNLIRTARLPLSEHLVIKTRTVLTINQCFEIILGISEGKTWREVLLSAMPSRKKVAPKEEEADKEKAVVEEKMVEEPVEQQVVDEEMAHEDEEL
jgi:tRNA (guanine9-N1)-methyltransferase